MAAKLALGVVCALTLVGGALIWHGPWPLMGALLVMIGCYGGLGLAGYELHRTIAHGFDDCTALLGKGTRCQFFMGGPGRGWLNVLVHTDRARGWACVNLSQAELLVSRARQAQARLEIHGVSVSQRWPWAATARLLPPAVIVLAGCQRNIVVMLAALGVSALVLHLLDRRARVLSSDVAAWRWSERGIVVHGREGEARLLPLQPWWEKPNPARFESFLRAAL